MATIDTHRASYSRPNPNIRVGSSYRKADLIQKFDTLIKALDAFQNQEMHATDRILVRQAYDGLISSRRAVRLMVKK